MDEIKSYNFTLFGKLYFMWVSNRHFDSAVKFFNDLNNGVDFHLAKLDFVKSYFVTVFSNSEIHLIFNYSDKDIIFLYKNQPRSFYYEDAVNKIFPIWETYTKAKNRENIIDNLFSD